MNFKNVNVPKMPGGGAASALIKLGVVAGIGVYGVANSLYNVEGATCFDDLLKLIGLHPDYLLDTLVPPKF